MTRIRTNETQDVMSTEHPRITRMDANRHKRRLRVVSRDTRPCDVFVLFEYFAVLLQIHSRSFARGFIRAYSFYSLAP